MFITFEGIEGSGKSTQIRLLAEALTRRGHGVVLTREPGGTLIGDQIRKILLDGANKNMTRHCETLLYWAARDQHVEELIRPALAQGKIVLCDRFVDSTIAYQGYARGLDFDVLKNLRDLVCGNVKVERTFLFDLPVPQGLARARGRNDKRAAGEREDRFENEALAFHEKVRGGFLDMARQEPRRFVIIDSSENKNRVHERVVQIMDELLLSKGVA